MKSVRPAAASLFLLMTQPLVQAASPGQSQTEWKQIVAGKNLALGKEMIFAPTPLFRKTTDGTETQKLTDGKWREEALPHSKNAVGWGYLNGQVHMILDLGAEQSVGAVVARFQGGEGDRTITLPRQISILLSDDGHHYYQAASTVKVTGGESELAIQSPEKYFYLPELGKYFIHPFVFRIERKARYVALTVTPGVNNLFSDEIFVMESANPAACARLEGLEKAHFISKGVEIRPKSGDLFVTTNVVTPNFFSVGDMRTNAEKKQPVRFFFDLPQGIDLKMGWKGTAVRDADAPEGRNRWIVANLWDAEKPDWQGAEGPVYFIPRDGVKIPEGATATFSSDEPASADNRVTVPIRGLEIPEVPPLADLDISLTWMSESDHSALYPHFFEAFSHFGFTAVGTFPRNAKTPEEKEKLRLFAEQAHENGLGVIYNESPFNVMEQLFANHPEIFNQVDGKRGEHLCPTYTGEYYRKEIQRIAEGADLVHPDLIFNDTELWYRGTQECRKCSRCREAFKKSGLSDWSEFMHAQGTRMTRDLSEAVSGKAPGGKNPISGNYNVVADPPVYHGIFEFKALYPQYFQFGMPVLYVRGDVGKVHEVIRKNYEAMGQRQIIPWLTAGTYGEFPPLKVEQMILETLLNGARGLTYYRFQDNDPMDYYHQAVALCYLAPYQALLKNGSLLKAEEGNKALEYSVWGDGREALVLIGNYRESGPEEETSLVIEGRKISELTDLKTREKIPVAAPILRVAAGSQALLHCRFER